MARYRYSPAPSGQGPEEIDVTTVPVPDEWRAGPLAAGQTPGRVGLTGPALDRLVDVLEKRTVDSPDDLVQALGPPPADPADQAAWQAQALQLERARASGGLHLVGKAAHAAASVAPPTFFRYGGGPRGRGSLDRRS